MANVPSNIRKARWFVPGDPSTLRTYLSTTAFALICLELVVSTILFGSVDNATWIILSGITFLIATAWLLIGISKKEFPLNRDILILPIAVLILIGVVQILPLFATTVPPELLPDGYRSGISVDPYATRLFVARLVLYLIFFAACLTFLPDKTRLKTIVVGTLGFGTVMAIFGILQRVSQTDMIYGIRPTPQAIAFGPFVNQHHFAAFMVMASGLAFGFLFAGDLKRERRFGLIFAVVVMGAAAVMTSSRGGLISFVAALIFAQLAHFMIRPSAAEGDRKLMTREQRFLAVSGSIALLILIFGTVIFLGADSSLIRGIGLGGGDVSNGRSHFWAVALQIFADHPILGAGLDAFGNAFPRYDTWPGIYRVEQAHNEYLQILADAGIAGFACIVAFIYFLFRKGLSVVAATSDPFRRAAAIGALAGCFGILIHSFFDFPLRTPSNAFFFLMFAAIAVCEIRSLRRHRTLTSKSF